VWRWRRWDWRGQWSSGADANAAAISIEFAMRSRPRTHVRGRHCFRYGVFSSNGLHLSNMPAFDLTFPRLVSVGGMEKPQLVQALREQGVQFNQAAEALFADERFTTLSERRVIEINAVSVGALGFKGGATYGELAARAAILGLSECPLELGPHLRLQLLDQADGPDDFPVTRKEHRAPPGSITIASAPLDDCDETPKGFYLRRVAGVDWLRGYWSWPGHVWSPEDVLAFSKGSR
jgi:hypothetical protein